MPHPQYVAVQDSSPVARDRALGALVSVGPLYQVDRVLAIVLGKSTRPQVRMRRRAPQDSVRQRNGFGSRLGG
jgi:hypothetical protein